MLEDKEADAMQQVTATNAVGVLTVVTRPLFQAIGTFKRGGFPADYPEKVRRFYSPQDEVHSVIKALLNSASSSLHISMYGLDDPELTGVVLVKANDPKVFVQVNLDKSQAGGKGEVPLVKLLEGCPSTRVAIGMSADHAINHLKMAVVDGLYTLSGSTNWSKGGESAQNNECSIHMDRAIAHEAITVLTLEHQQMLDQMAKGIPNV